MNFFLIFVLIVLLIIFFSIKNTTKFTNNNDNLEKLSNISNLLLHNNDITLDTKLNIYGSLNIFQNQNLIKKGHIIAYIGDTIPFGWCECDGNIYKTTEAILRDDEFDFTTLSLKENVSNKFSSNHPLLIYLINNKPTEKNSYNNTILPRIILSISIDDYTDLDKYYLIFDDDGLFDNDGILDNIINSLIVAPNINGNEKFIIGSNSNISFGGGNNLINISNLPDHYHSYFRETIDGDNGVRECNTGCHKTDIYYVHDRAFSRFEFDDKIYDNDGNLVSEHLPYYPKYHSVKYLMKT